jgi:hypothetical protein
MIFSIYERKNSVNLQETVDQIYLFPFNRGLFSSLVALYIRQTQLVEVFHKHIVKIPTDFSRFQFSCYGNSRFIFCKRLRQS